MAKVKNHSYKVYEIFGTPSDTKGEVGLEIETIGKSLPNVFTKTKLWAVHADGSVKPRPGEVCMEYVFQQPVGRPKVQQALQELHEEFKAFKSVVEEGRRSNSVHVHLNAQQLTIQQVYTWLAVYFVFEELLVRWAGPNRVGNLFCLRARDAEGVLDLLAQCAKADQFKAFHDDNYRYAAANIVALTKFGSLEFRALRGTVDQKVIQTWINVLLAIKDKSLTYESPVAVLRDFSRRSPLGFCRHIIPDEMSWWMMHEGDFQSSLYDGARLSQDFAFATEWQNKPAVTEKPPEAPKMKNKYVFPNGQLGTPPSLNAYFATLNSAEPAVWSTTVTAPPHPGVFSDDL